MSYKKSGQGKNWNQITGKDAARMESLLEELKRKLGSDADWYCENDELSGEPVTLLGLGSLIDVFETKESIRKYLTSAPGRERPENRFLGFSEEARTAEEAIEAILSGKLLVFRARTGECWIAEPVAKPLMRQIGTPNIENVVRGPVAAFTEDIRSNIGIARQYLQSGNLRVEMKAIGAAHRIDVAVLYVEGRADTVFLGKLNERLQEGKNGDVSTLQGLIRVLGFPMRSIVSRLQSTELPAEAVGALKKGRVVLFVDRMPYALVLPTQLWDLFALESDLNFPRPIMHALRALRLIGALITILLPALYVALVAVNPEALRIQLALSVAQSREGVPYPALLETLLLLLIIELILEGSIRLPKSVGPTITMVGGIVIGQAVVTAKLVSNLLIIILAATTIANSAIAGFQNSYTIRSLKYVTLLLAAVFGVLGIFAGFLLICAYFASQHTYGVSYVQLRFAKDELPHG
ncbi:spore germination protein [Cohnella xylanilytica]|uniref:spore germination protein n=1 Tax=Cohnella xylanilytica TaxID=557555 RepID=UPI001BB431E6|nr:spore germination protein [Cohnella xylanilytica]